MLVVDKLPHDISAVAAPSMRSSFSMADSPSEKVMLYGKLEDAVTRQSPDGKYIAAIVALDGEAGRLLISRAVASRKGFIHHSLVLADDTHGCIWLPNRGHALAFSSGGADYGVGILAVWYGPGHRKVLQHARTAAGEGFNIRGVTADGDMLIYEHFGNNSPDPNYKRNLSLAYNLSSVRKLHPI